MALKLFFSQTFVAFVVLFLPLVTSSSEKNAMQEVTRPELVRKSLENNDDLYYFALGSNMLRSKLENRSICGNKIHVKSMEPAFVEDYRLAFNMRGFPPLEPGMGSLEPVKKNKNLSRPLVAYQKDQCHGALVRLSAADYEKVMRSEGVGNGNKNQGYEEVVVNAFPYKKGQRPVQAISLRAREHVRLQFDPAPSLRYLEILRKGAGELGLCPTYQEFLNNHPAALVSTLTRKVAVCNLIWTSILSFRLKVRLFSKIQSWFLWKVYTPPTASLVTRFFSELAIVAILLPGAIPGSLLFLYLRRAKKMSGMMESLVKSHW